MSNKYTPFLNTENGFCLLPEIEYEAAETYYGKEYAFDECYANWHISSIDILSSESRLFLFAIFVVNLNSNSRNIN